MAATPTSQAEIEKLLDEMGSYREKVGSEIGSNSTDGSMYAFGAKAAALKARLLTVYAAPAWRPIAEASLDGTEYLIASIRNGVVEEAAQAMWKFLEHDDDGEPIFGWNTPNGTPDEPTHFMSLPAHQGDEPR